MRLLVPLLLIVLAGCSQSARFGLSIEGRDPATVRAEQRQAIAAALEELFGTPNEPRTPEEVELRIDRIQAAAGEIGSDHQGRRWGLYRHHCVACHGISGDGAGATAAVLSPYPRDFRNGVFKYTSTTGGAKPVVEDLARTLRRGIPGTSMPSFARLEDEEIEALVEYVKYLSIRGETQLYLVAQVLDEDEPLPLDLEAVCEEAVLPAARSWLAARDRAIPPMPDERLPPAELQASVERGRQVFLRKGSRCVECHGEQGRGDGELADSLYDDWNKRKLADTPTESRRRAGWFPLPLEPLRPRNFHEGIFRGGDRFPDLYWRIAAGIKGTPMPASGPSEGSPAVLRQEEVQDVVRYVLSLGHSVENRTAE